MKHELVSVKPAEVRDASGKETQNTEGGREVITQQHAALSMKSNLSYHSG